MAVERIYYCDGPDCGDGEPCHMTSSAPPPYLPGGFVETRQSDASGEASLFFCSWDCVMKFAAGRPPSEVIPFVEPE